MIHEMIKKKKKGNAEACSTDDTLKALWPATNFATRQDKMLTLG